MSNRPNLRVIDGDNVQCERWLDIPGSVAARDPSNPSARARFRVARDDLLKGAAVARRQPAYDFWSGVLGQFPPVPGATGLSTEGFSRLIDAHACYQGLLRPWDSDNSGDHKLAFILKPTAHAVHQFLSPIVFCKKNSVPSDLVFVVYAKLDFPRYGPMKGVITHWQFVEADKDNPLLPVNFAARYKHKCW